MENLQCSGISLNMENSGNSMQPRKNCNKQSIFSSWFKHLVRVRWWPVILLELMWNDPWWRSLLHLLFVAITYGKVWLWKSLENSKFFSPALWPPYTLVIVSEETFHMTGSVVCCYRVLKGKETQWKMAVTEQFCCCSVQWCEMFAGRNW